MTKHAMIRALRCPAIGAAGVLLAACYPEYNPRPAQPLAPGPTSAEIAQYARAQTDARLGLATGDGAAVARANDTFAQIPREILSRQDPNLFAAMVVCEQYPVAAPATTSRYTPPGPTIEPNPCENVKWRYDGKTAAIRRSLEARIASADYATIAQSGAAQP